MNIGGVSHSEDDEDYGPNIAPGARPIPDDQGNLEVCTRFAVSKAIVDGFMRKMFVRGREVDIDQDQVTVVLLNEHKDGTGKWPVEFHHKVYQFKDKEARYWKTNLFVHKLHDVLDFVNDVMNKVQLHTYVLVYPLNPSNPNGAKHCVYADFLDPKTRNVECINSDPADPFPSIPISRRGNALYRVSCTASEMTLGPLASPGHRPSVNTVRMREKPPRPSDHQSPAHTAREKRYSSPCHRLSQGSSTPLSSRRNSRRVSECSEGGAPRRLSGLLSSPHHGAIPRARSAASLTAIQDQHEVRGRLSQQREEDQYYEADYHHSPSPSSEARDQYPQHFTFEGLRENIPTIMPRNFSEPALQHYFLPSQLPTGHSHHDQTDSANKKKSRKFGSMKSLFKMKK